jgi:putative ABC transport system permease protein
VTPTLWKYTLREVQRRPGRTLLTLIGIVIGVATIVAVTATTRATRRSYQNMFEELGGKAALEIVAPGQGGFDPAPALQTTQDVKDIEAAVGIIQNRAGLHTKTGILPVLVLGIDPARDQAVRQWEVRHGRDLDEGDGVLLGANFAAHVGIGLGDAITLTETGPTGLNVVGLLETRGPANFNGGALAVMPLYSAQKLFRLDGQVNSIQLVLREGADPERVKEQLEARLPKDVQVQTPVARAALGRSSLMSTEQGLSTLSVVSLVGGGFVILNSFLMNLGERRRQLAILRSLGTTREQVTRLLLREAILLGGAGTVLGMGLGVLLARGLVRMLQGLLGVTLPPMQLGAEPFVLALIFGPGMAVAATTVPAHMAGRRSPLEAMRPKRTAPEPSESRPRWPAYLGLCSILLCAVFLFGTFGGLWGQEFSTILLAPAMMLFLIGCVLVLPAVLTPLLHVTRIVLRPIFGAEGSLAFRQLERQHTRTSLTAGVLFIGVMVTASFGNALLNNIDDIDRWYRPTIPADFYIRGTVAETGTLWASFLKREIGDELAQLDGVEQVGRVNFSLVWAQGSISLALSRDFPADRNLPLALTEGTEEEVRAGLANGETVIGSPLAHRTGLGRGDNLIVATRQGNQPLRIAGVVKEYTVGGQAFYVTWETGQKLFGLKEVNTFEVFAKEGQVERVDHSVRAYCERKGLLALSNEQVRGGVDKAVKSVEGFLWVLIVLVFVVAALGIVNTLTMNVHEQTRELGVLRAIGLKRSQLRKLVLAQAAGLGLLSVLPGIAGGVVLAWLMNAATYSFSGHRIEFTLRVGFMVYCAAVALTVALLAALLPARRAAGLRIIEALHYE